MQIEAGHSYVDGAGIIVGPMRRQDPDRHGQPWVGRDSLTGEDTTFSDEGRFYPDGRRSVLDLQHPADQSPQIEAA